MTLDEQHSIAVDRHGETPQQVCSVHRQCFCDGAMPDHHERQVLVVLHGCEGSTPTWVDQKKTSCSPLLPVHPPLSPHTDPDATQKSNPAQYLSTAAPLPTLRKNLSGSPSSSPIVTLLSPGHVRRKYPTQRANVSSSTPTSAAAAALLLAAPPLASAELLLSAGGDCLRGGSRWLACKGTAHSTARQEPWSMSVLGYPPKCRPVVWRLRALK